MLEHLDETVVAVATNERRVGHDWIFRLSNMDFTAVQSV